MDMNEEYKKNFDAWNEYAKILDVMEFKGILHEGHVWWCALGINIGREEDGKNEHFERPVLLFRKISSDTLWVIPFTSKSAEKKSSFLYTFSFNGNIETAKLSQMRLISNQRLLKYIGTISPDDFKNIRNMFISLI